LAPKVVELLWELYREDGNPHLFIGARSQQLGEMAMYSTLHRVGRTETVHGFRSAFSDWAHERTAHSNHVIEMCLAHSIGSEVEKAYRRTDLFNKRRALMEQWATFVSTAPKAAQKADVVPLRRGTPA
jgi:integrase